MVPHYSSVIVESNRIIDGQPLDLTELLNDLHHGGWDVKFVMPNGVNRWTVVAERRSSEKAEKG